jgi:ribosomal protein L37AE/L43A
MFWRRMLLWLSVRDYRHRIKTCTSFCAVNESGDRFATSGWRCHECGRCSVIGPLLSRLGLAAEVSKVGSLDVTVGLTIET